MTNEPPGPQFVTPLTTRPPETVLPPAPPEAVSGAAQAMLLAGDERRRALAEVVAVHPTFIEGWAQLAAAARDRVEAYAYARVGYHRGLDSLRGAGWRGSGFVRWANPTNRGFLRSVEALRSAASDIGETAEAERCALFLRQLEPGWGPHGPADL